MDQIKPFCPRWENVGTINNVTSRIQFKLGQELHIWKIKNGSLEPSSYYDILSAEEQTNALRFKFMEDQHRYILSHGILRLLLSSYMQCDIESLVISKSRYGKPMLNSPNGKNNILFNISHSKNITCFIFSVNTEVGIDIEYIDPAFNWIDIVNEIFTSREINYLMSLPAEAQIKGFYTIWTQKEALLKALGLGLFGIEEIRSVYEIKKITQDIIRFDKEYLGAFVACSEVSSKLFLNFH